MKKVEIPKIALPTLIIAFTCFFGLFINLYLVWRGFYGYYLGFSISLLCLYYAFTPLHEAAHGNVITGSGIRGKLNTFVGAMSGFLLLAPYVIFRPLHLKHHSFVNNPQKDPDYWVAGKNPIAVIFKTSTIFFHYYYFYFKSSKNLKNSLAAVAAYNLIFALVSLGVVKLTSLEHFLTLWIGPFFVTMTLLGLTFDYIPHHPHDDQTRYNNARTFPGFLRSLLMANHNYHIIHHLYPRIPFYLYQKTFDSMDKKERDLHQRIYH